MKYIHIKKDLREIQALLVEILKDKLQFKLAFYKNLSP